MVQSPEQNRERAKAWGRANPERNRARAKAWAAENRETIRGRGPAYSRKHILKTKFRMTPEDYDTMLDAQGGVCAICAGSEPCNRRLAVDHNHATGVVRGLLCTRCNNALGSFADDAARLERAADYLRLPALSEVCNGD